MVKKYLKALALTLIIFFSAFAVANFFYIKRDEQFAHTLSKVNYKFEEFKALQLYYDTFDDDNGMCNYFSSEIANTGKSIYAMGKQIQWLENLNKFDSKVLDLKEKFSILNFKLWLYYVNLKRNCDKKDFDTILYFYSNKKYKQFVSESQGLQLDLLKKTHPEVLVFAFESELPNSDVVSQLKKKFSVNEIPTIVINESKKLEGFKSEEDIAKHLK